MKATRGVGSSMGPVCPRHTFPALQCPISFPPFPSAGGWDTVHTVTGPPQESGTMPQECQLRWAWAGPAEKPQMTEKSQSWNVGGELVLWVAPSSPFPSGALSLLWGPQPSTSLGRQAPGAQFWWVVPVRITPNASHSLRSPGLSCPSRQAQPHWFLCPALVFPQFLIVTSVPGVLTHTVPSSAWGFSPNSLSSPAFTLTKLLLVHPSDLGSSISLSEQPSLPPGSVCSLVLVPFYTVWLFDQYLSSLLGHTICVVRDWPVFAHCVWHLSQSLWLPSVGNQ